MTMGIRPRPWVSSALMGDLAPKNWLYFSLNELEAWQVGNKTCQAPWRRCAGRLALLTHQLVERHVLLDGPGLAKDEVGHVVLDHDRLDLGQAAVVAVVPAHHVGRAL